MVMDSLTKEINKAASTQAVEKMKRAAIANYKDYDVFGSRLVFLSTDKQEWMEKFSHIGSVKAFNSNHAIIVAKEQFPQWASRIAVIAAAHPLSPTSQAQSATAKASAAMQTSMLLNKIGQATGRK